MEKNNRDKSYGDIVKDAAQGPSKNVICVWSLVRNEDSYLKTWMNLRIRMDGHRTLPYGHRTPRGHWGELTADVMERRHTPQLILDLEIGHF